VFEDRSLARATPPRSWGGGRTCKPETLWPSHQSIRI